MGSVNGKVVLITGGANGVGAEVARRLHDKGAKLVLTDLDEGRLKEVAARLGEIGFSPSSPTCVIWRPCRPPPTRAVEKFGGIDIVMANAGIATVGTVSSVDPAGVHDADRRECGRRVQHCAGGAAVGDRAPRLRPWWFHRWRHSPRRRARPVQPRQGGRRALRERPAAGSRPPRCGTSGRRTCRGSTPRWFRRVRPILTAFKDTIDSAPWPVEQDHVVGKCGEAFVKGIEGRKRQINCPGWVGAFRWLRPLFTTPIGEKQMSAGFPNGCRRWTPKSPRSAVR